MKSTFLNALAQDGAINEATLSNENLAQTYGSLQKQVSESLKKQEKLLADIQVKSRIARRRKTSYIFRNACV